MPRNFLPKRPRYYWCNKCGKYLPPRLSYSMIKHPESDTGYARRVLLFCPICDRIITKRCTMNPAIKAISRLEQRCNYIAGDITMIASEYPDEVSQHLLAERTLGALPYSLKLPGQPHDVVVNRLEKRADYEEELARRKAKSRRKNKECKRRRREREATSK